MFVALCLELFINLKTKTYKTLFDNIKFMKDLLFSIYFDFETIPGKNICNFDEDNILYPVSHAFVVIFHLDLNIEKTFVVGSFNHMSITGFACHQQHQIFQIKKY